MYKSKEARWFFKEPNKTIATWFAAQGKEILKTQSRADFYLPLPGKDDISVKLREGNVEIKQRYGQPVLYPLTVSVTGYLEDWVKWSFNVADNDLLAKLIIKDKKHEWIEVYKERTGVKITSDMKGNFSIHNMESTVASGCQIEYTRVRLRGREWFSFGLEWFGDEHLLQEHLFPVELFSGVRMEANDSMSYSKFLSRAFAASMP